MQAPQQAAAHWPRREPLSVARADFEEIDPPPFLLDGEYERVVRIADLELDPEWHAVSRGGQQITLTRIQFQLLAILAEHVNDVVDYDVLVAEAWGHSDEDSPASLVKSHISRLRRKLGLGPLDTLAIKSSPGRGYMLRLR